MKVKFGLMIASLLILGLLIVVWMNNRKGTKEEKTSLRPTLSVASLSVKNIHEDKIELASRWIIRNPLPVEIKTSGVGYKVLINGTQVSEDSLRKPVTIRARDSTVVELPMDIEIKPMGMALKALEKQNADSAEYTLQATLALDLPVAGNRKFDLKETWKLPALQLIKIKPEELDLKKLKWKESVLSFTLQLTNPNVFPFRMKNAEYELTLANDLVMSGTKEEVTVIPANGTVSVPLELEVKNKAMSKLMWKTLFDKDETPLSTTFRCQLISNTRMLDNSEMVMHTTGKLSDLKGIGPLPKK